MELTTSQKLQTYITAETRDAALYRELSSLAPNGTAADTLLDISADEQAHADEFKYLYRRLTGHTFQPPVEPVTMEGDYTAVLHERIGDESGDYRKYGEQYLLTPPGSPLRDAYYRARTDENVHALRLLDLLTEGS